MTKGFRPFLFGLLIGAASFAAAPAQAQESWRPAGAVRVIVPFAPGGATDVLARIVSERLAAMWEQPVVVENISGATGAIGAAQVARAAPDGRTLFVGTGSVNSALPSVKSDLQFDTLRDFKAVSLLATFPNVIVVRPDMPVKTTQELVDWLKAHPNQASFGSSGYGSSIHLAGELFKLQTGTQMTHVPYRGSAPAMTDLIAGHIDLMFDNLTNVISHIQDGRVRALGVASAQRTRYMPDLPAVAETLPGFEATTWVGFLAPAKTPDDIVDRISRDADAVMRDAGVIARVTNLAAEPTGGTPAKFAEFLKADVMRWKNVVKDANMKVD